MNKDHIAIAAPGEQPAADTVALPPLTAAERVQRTRNRKIFATTLEIRQPASGAHSRRYFLQNHHQWLK
jgi:hypothetical protein